MPTEKRKIVLASRNEDKIREMSELCVDLPFAVGSALDYPGLPEVIEDGTSIMGNASRKALITAAYTGEIAVADDTALQIRALNELPDIFASRFAGEGASYEDNANLALELMANVPDGHRQARFVTCAVWVDPRPEHHLPPDLGPGAGTQLRWLHNPFARAIHVRDAAAEAEFWNAFGDRRQVWASYRAARASFHVTHGTDPARLHAIYDRLLAPFMAGERPAGAPADAVWLPDTRIWTTDAPGLSGEAPPPPLTVVTPAGLPADAPGRGLAEPLWVEFAAEGRILGEITRQPVGRLGFGYDPIFRPEGSDRTLAEHQPEEKNAVSHRGKALRRLLRAAIASYQAAA